MIAIFSDLHLGIKGDNQHWHSVAVEFIQDMVKTLKEKNIKEAAISATSPTCPETAL